MSPQTQRKEAYPGENARRFKQWFFGKSPTLKDRRQEICVIGEPVAMFTYRTVFAVKKHGERTYPDVVLQRSTRYHARSSADGQKIRRLEDTEATDLYADTFGEPELWYVIPAIVYEKALHGHPRGPAMCVRHFKFIELNEVDSLATLAVLQRRKVMNDGRLADEWFEVTHDPESSEGLWDRLPPQDQELSTLKVHRPEIYYSQVQDAYPEATLEQQKEVLATHFNIIKDHPEFAKRFPAIT